jgi:hypothetical protein
MPIIMLKGAMMNSLDRLMGVQVFSSSLFQKLSHSPWHVKGCINLLNRFGQDELNRMFEDFDVESATDDSDVSMKWRPVVVMLRMYGLFEEADELANIVNTTGGRSPNGSQSVTGFMDVLHYVNIMLGESDEYVLSLPNDVNSVGYNNIWVGESTGSTVQDVLNFVDKNWNAGKHLYSVYVEQISGEKIFMEKTWGNNRARNNIYDCLSFYYSQVSNITHKFISGNATTEGEIQKVLEFIDDSHVDILSKIISKGLFDSEGYHPPQTLQAMRGMMFAPAPLSRYSDYVDLVPEWFRKMFTV